MSKHKKSFISASEHARAILSIFLNHVIRFKWRCCVFYHVHFKSFSRFENSGPIFEQWFWILFSGTFLVNFAKVLDVQNPFFLLRKSKGQKFLAIKNSKYKYQYYNLYSKEKVCIFESTNFIWIFYFCTWGSETILHYISLFKQWTVFVFFIKPHQVFNSLVKLHEIFKNPKLGQKLPHYRPNRVKN